MRSPSLHRVIRLRLELMGSTPLVWREIMVDRDLTLGDLHDAILLSFGWPRDAHHLFTDHAPQAFTHDLLGAPRMLGWREGIGWAGDDASWHFPLGGGSVRRWGDRWTMIECRDPAVGDETAIRLGTVLEQAQPLYYSLDPEEHWWIRIDVGADDLVASSGTRARVIEGAGRAPLDEAHGMEEHNAVVALLADETHARNGALRERLERIVGPWDVYDPATFDLPDAQRQLDLRFGTTPRASGGRGQARASFATRSTLARLIEHLPPAARPGLRRHIASVGVQLRAVVSPEDAAETMRGLRWLLTELGSQGLSRVGNGIRPEVISAGAGALGYDDERMRRIVEAARRLGLMYARRGRFFAPRQAREALADPLALWRLVALSLLVRRSPGADTFDRALCLLAVVDGSVADDPQRAFARIAVARDILDDRRGWADSLWTERSLVDLLDEEDPAWLGFTRLPALLTAPRPAATAAAHARTRLAPFFDLLEIFGLIPNAAGGWDVPASVRELAREGLNAPSGSWW